MKEKIRTESMIWKDIFYADDLVWADVRRNCRKFSIAAIINGSLRNEPFKRCCNDEELRLDDEDDDVDDCASEFIPVSKKSYSDNKRTFSSDSCRSERELSQYYL